METKVSAPFETLRELKIAARYGARLVQQLYVEQGQQHLGL